MDGCDGAIRIELANHPTLSIPISSWWSVGALKGQPDAKAQK
jgi:hypothetical protein